MQTVFKKKKRKDLKKFKNFSFHSKIQSNKKK